MVARIDQRPPRFTHRGSGDLYQAGLLEIECRSTKVDLYRGNSPPDENVPEASSLSLSKQLHAIGSHAPLEIFPALDLFIPAARQPRSLDRDKTVREVEAARMGQTRSYGNLCFTNGELGAAFSYCLVDLVGLSISTFFFQFRRLLFILFFGKNNNVL